MWSETYIEVLVRQLRITAPTQLLSDTSNCLAVRVVNKIQFHSELYQGTNTDTLKYSWKFFHICIFKQISFLSRTFKSGIKNALFGFLQNYENAGILVEVGLSIRCLLSFACTSSKQHPRPHPTETGVEVITKCCDTLSHKLIIGYNLELPSQFSMHHNSCLFHNRSVSNFKHPSPHKQSETFHGKLCHG